MIRHENATVDDVRIHYVTAGDGPALLLIHGFPQFWYSWHKVIPALAERYTVIVPDMRGAGRSSRPQGGYDKHQVMEDLRGLVRGLGHERVAVAGHDVGGQVAYRYAAVHPDEVTKLAILESVVPGTPAWTELRASPGAWHVNFQAERDVPEMLVAGREREYASYFLMRGTIDPSKFPLDEVQIFAEAFAAPGAARAAFELYRAMMQDAEDNLPYLQNKLKTPTLQLAGGMSSSGWRQEAMIRSIVENPRFESVLGVGHWLCEEKPEETSRILLEFLDS